MKSFLAMASRTIAGVILKLLILAAFRFTQYSLFFPPEISTFDAPSTCERKGLTVYCAVQLRSIGVLSGLLNTYPITVVTEYMLIFSTFISTSGGSMFLIWLIRDSICCSLISISASQFRKIFISHSPRLVVL